MVLCFGFRMRIINIKPMFWLLQNSAAQIQGCFSFSELGVRKKLRGTEPGQLTQTEQREIPYLIMSLNSKTGGVGHGVATDWGLAGHQLAGGEQLHCASLVLYTLLVIFFSFPIFTY